MRRTIAGLTVAIAIAIAISGAANAGVATGAHPLAPQVKTPSLIENVACWRGERDGCPYHMKHGGNGACIPCEHGTY